MNSQKQVSLEPSRTGWVVTRRDFLRCSGFVVAGLACGIPLAHAGDNGGKAKLSFGIVTEAHYADKPGTGRVYRESIAKMTECVKLMNDKKVDFLVELGDLIDKGEEGQGEEACLKRLDAIEAIYKTFNGPRYHVLGNHDMGELSKAQFMSRIENTGIDKNATYYAYDSKDVHFVVLDACFTSKGEDYAPGKFGWRDTIIPPKELEWLQKDLASTSKPVIVFVHQLLTGQGNTCVKNSDKVRTLLQDSKKVLAVFHGHHHPGGYVQLEGIHYYTSIAMVEGSGEKNNAYAIVDVHDDNSLTVTGYRRAISKELSKA